MPDQSRPCDGREVGSVRRSPLDAPASNTVLDSAPRRRYGCCPRRAVLEVQDCADCERSDCLGRKCCRVVVWFLCQTTRRNNSGEMKSIDTSDKVQVECCWSVLPIPHCVVWKAHNRSYRFNFGQNTSSFCINFSSSLILRHPHTFFLLSSHSPHVQNDGGSDSSKVTGRRSGVDARSEKRQRRSEG